MVSLGIDIDQRCAVSSFSLRDINNIPAALQSRLQWTLWRQFSRAGKTAKVPWSVYDKPASSTDSSTWHDFETAVVQYREGYHAGLSFALVDGGGIVGVDFDGCRDPETGEVDEWAMRWLRQLPGYAEISPSGTGVKLFVRSNILLRKGINKKLDLPAKYGKSPGIEVYSGRRFFAVTGQALPGFAGGLIDE
jgi:putative DNA primase/helicase